MSGRAAGVPDEAIDAIKDGSKAFAEPFDLVSQIVDCAFAYRSIPQALQDRIVGRFGLHGLIEIVTLCGYYSMMAMVNGCFDVPLPHWETH